MHSQVTFQSMIDQFKSKTEYQAYINSCQKKYQLKIYRVNTMKLCQAGIYYTNLKQKYEKKIYQIEKNSWHENERRLFIWFIICFIRLKGNISFDDDNSWTNISKIFFKKDIRLLKYQYRNILKSNGRVYWTEEEDEILRDAFQKYPKGQWNQIAKHLFFSTNTQQFKNPKHCRQRWQNHLDKRINKDPWNDEQDYQLLTLVKQYGKKWSKLSQQTGRKRTQHMIKNRYNSLLTHAQFKGSSDETLDYLIEKYHKKLQSAKFTFFNNIIIVNNEDTQGRKTHQNIFQAKQQDSEKKQQIQEKLPRINIINCGKNQLDKSRTTDSLKATIQEKLFGSSTSQFFNNDNKSQYSNWPQRSICHTPGNFFFQDRSNSFQKRFNEARFRLDSKGSFDKSQIAASMEILKPARTDMSQQYKMLSSSSADVRSGLNNKNDLSCEIKEL